MFITGFEIQSVKPEDAGKYDAHVTYVDGDDRQKCQTSLEISVKGKSKKWVQELKLDSSMISEP